MERWRRATHASTVETTDIRNNAVTTNGVGRMPKFMDVHTGMAGVTAEQLAAAHQADLDIQDEEGVDFQQAWADPASGHVFCLSEAPSAEAVQRIHERAGHRADEVHQITVTA